LVICQIQLVNDKYFLSHILKASTTSLSQIAKSAVLKADQVQKLLFALVRPTQLPAVRPLNGVFSHKVTPPGPVADLQWQVGLPVGSLEKKS
jgi:hypothetical protein